MSSATFWWIGHKPDGQVVVTPIHGRQEWEWFYPEPNPHFKPQIYLPNHCYLKHTRKEAINDSIAIYKGRKAGLLKQIEDCDLILKNLEALL